MKEPYRPTFDPVFGRSGLKLPVAVPPIAFSLGAAYSGNYRGVQRGQTAFPRARCLTMPPVIRDPRTKPVFPKLNVGAVGPTVNQLPLYSTNLAVGTPVLSSAVSIK